MSRLLRFAVLVTMLCALLPSVAGAQARPRGPHPPARPRPPAVAVRGEFVFVGGYFYDPFFGPYPWWMHGAYPRWYSPAYDYRSELRIQAKPKEAAVYVDGFYAGTVDDFDGIFQRLLLPPGGHTITLYLNGFRTTHDSLYLKPRSSMSLHQTLQPLPPGIASEPPPLMPAVPPPPPGSYRYPRTPPPLVTALPPLSAPPAVEDYAALDLRVQPADATVTIDGRPWMTSEPGHFVVQVAEGSHHVEVSKAGYRPFSTEVTLLIGSMTPLNVSLMPAAP